jgi:hypothetical protein
VADTDGDGQITKEEFRQLLHTDETDTLLQYDDRIAMPAEDPVCEVVNATGGSGEEAARCAAEAKKATLINRLSGLFKKAGDNVGL